jgi:ATP-binding cassette subfamily B protein
MMKFRKVWHNFICFIKLIKIDHPHILWIILVGAFTSALQPFVNLIFYSRILDKVLSGLYQKCISDVIILLVSMLVLSLISQACRQSVIVLQEASNDTIFLRTADKAYTMEFEEFEKTETMDAIRRVRSGENGSGGIENQIQSICTLAEQAFAILFSIVFVVMLFLQVDTNSRNFFNSPWSTVQIVIVFAAVMFLCIKLSGKSYKKFYEANKKNEHINSLSQYLIDVAIQYQNGKDIRIYSMQGLLEKYFYNLSMKIYKYYLKWGSNEGFYTGVIMLLTQLTSGLVYIIIGGKAIYGVISTGEVLMYAGAILQLTGAIRKEITEYNEFSYRMEYLNTYYEFINQPDIHYKGTLPIEKRSDTEYEFTFEHVSFQYPGTEEMVLKDINLKFKIGEKFAIVGRNGAGKTTLIKLLCRLYDPLECRILLNGIDIKYYDYAEYTKVFSVVFQDFKLLSLPLADNISSGETVDEKRMWSVLDQVGMKDRVERMPNKLSTRLYKNNGEGIEISGGEAQKLAIARALYKDGPFVILDEPTAALDPFAEAEIYENFNDMIQGKTAIYISHRMSSCKFCDDIIVLDGGRIAERGDHETLLNQNGIYASLFQAQAKYYTS